MTKGDVSLPNWQVPKTMLLPEGTTCNDCIHFKRTCEWLISCNPNNTLCDWAPSRFTSKEKHH